MADSFDERLKQLEQEINDIRTARQRLTGATTTISKPILVKGWAISQEYGRPYSVGQTVATIKPKEPANGFFFHFSQPGIRNSGDWYFEYYIRPSDDFTEFIAELNFAASYDNWEPGEIRTFTTPATIVASGEFDYTVEYIEPEEES